MNNNRLVKEKKRAIELDETDTLQAYREKFMLDDPRLIYLDGNSLGVLPKATSENQIAVLQYEWGERLIRSWNEGWYSRSLEISKKIAKIIGAYDDEVIVCDSTTLNLFKLIYAALVFQKDRHVIISDDLNFPTDLYVLQGVQKVLRDQHSIKLIESPDQVRINQKDIEEQLDADTALVSFSHVAFRSAFMYDIKSITELAHAAGSLILWDVSHSVGVVPLNLSDNKVDMAVGCTYKYLNGGPGSPAFMYVSRELQNQLESPVWGWFGHQNPFDFELEYHPVAGMRKFLTGTPPILSLSPLNTALDIVIEAGIENIREKSTRQTGLFIKLFETYLKPLGFKLQSPLREADRGSHVTLSHPDAYRICKTLISEDIGMFKVIPDFREPDMIRFGFAPLYTRYSDLVETITELTVIMKNKSFESFPNTRDDVT